jgi:hypothetical protein
MTDKVTKDDYEDVYNELLGIDINWSKLPLEDLKALSVLFSNPELLAKKLGYQTDKEKKRAVRREKILEQSSALVLDRLDKGKGPLAKLYKKFIDDDDEDEKSDKFQKLERLVEEKPRRISVDVGGSE